MLKRDLTWWFWLATDAALAWSLFADREAIKLAIGLAAAQVPVFARRGGGIASFPAQVRIAYTALLVVGLWLPLIHWVQLVGTTAMILCGYCFLARCLSLLPMNRTQKLDLRMLRKTFLSRPVQGSIVAARNAMLST